MMVDRRSLGDAGLAVLLALPTAALARYPADLPPPHATAYQAQAQNSAAAHMPVRSRFGFAE
jgi:hypothetical protein